MRLGSFCNFSTKFRLLLSKKSPKPRESDKLKNLSQLEPLSKKTAPNRLKTYFKFIMKVLRKIILGFFIPSFSLVIYFQTLVCFISVTKIIYEHSFAPLFSYLKSLVRRSNNLRPKGYLNTKKASKRQK